MQQEAYQQVGPTRQTPWVLCGGGVFDLHHYHPCTMLEGLPLVDPMKKWRLIKKKIRSSYFLGFLNEEFI